MLPIAPRLVYLYLLFNGEKIKQGDGKTHTREENKKRARKTGQKPQQKTKKKDEKQGGDNRRKNKRK